MTVRPMLVPTPELMIAGLGEPEMERNSVEWQLYHDLFRALLQHFSLEHYTPVSLLDLIRFRVEAFCFLRDYDWVGKCARAPDSMSDGQTDVTYDIQQERLEIAIAAHTDWLSRIDALSEAECDKQLRAAFDHAFSDHDDQKLVSSLRSGNLTLGEVLVHMPLWFISFEPAEDEDDE